MRFGRLVLLATTFASFLASFEAHAEPAMQLQASARIGSSIVVAGIDVADVPYVKVGKLLPDGNMDMSFGAGGWAQVSTPQAVPATVTAVSMQPDGKVVVALKTGNNDLALLRLNVDGTSDTGFGNYYAPGYYLMPGYDVPTRVNALYIEPTGFIAGFGSYQYGSSPYAAVIRFTPDGTPDTNMYGIAAGTRVFTYPGSRSVLNSFAIDADGGVIAVGGVQLDSCCSGAVLVMKLVNDPAAGGYGLASGWGYGDGWTMQTWSGDGGAGQAAYQVTRDSQGRYLVATASDAPSASVVRMGSFRLLANGQLDGSYFGGILEAGYPQRSQYDAFPAGIIELGGDALIVGTAFDAYSPHNSYIAHQGIEIDNLEPFRTFDGALVAWRPGSGTDQFTVQRAYPIDAGAFLVVGTRDSGTLRTFYRARFFTQDLNSYYPGDDKSFDTDYADGPVDSTPNPIDYFPSEAGYVPKKGEVLSPRNPFRISGITVPIPLTVVNGTVANANDWQYSGDPREVNNGDLLDLRVASSTTPNTAVTATLTIGSITKTFTVTSGDVPPVSIVQSPANNSAAPATFNFANPRWNAYDGSTYECSLDDAAFSACPYTGITYSTLVPGSHTFRVRATNSWGTGAPDSYTWSVVGVPDTLITSQPAALVNATSATFAFTSADSPTSFQCKVDNESYATCTSPFTRTGLANGAHAFSVRAVNGAGTDPTPASATWTIDTVAPDTFLSVIGTRRTGVPRVSVAFSSNDSTATFECSLDQGAFTACASPRLFDNLSDGNHSYAVRARDAAGNVDPTPALGAVIVDTQPPDTTFAQTPASTVTSTGVTFYLQSTADPAVYQILIECTLDGVVQNYVNCSGQQLYVPTDGPHTFSARAWKYSWNEYGDSMKIFDPTPLAYTFTVDLPPPDTTIAPQYPTGTISTSSVTINFWSTPYTPLYECSFDGAAFTACSPDMTYSNLADGDHTFAVRAKTATKTDPTPATRTFTVAVAAPDTSISGGPVGTVASTAASFALSATITGATFECSLDGAAFAACTSPTTYNALAQGAHTFAARARTAERTDPTPATRSWSVDTTPPVITFVSAPYPVTSITSAQFQFTLSEPWGSLSCSLDGGASFGCATSYVVSNLANGAHTFTVAATDVAGNAASVTWSWTIDPNDRPQTFLDSGPAGAVAQSAVTFTFHADRPGSTFICSIAGNRYDGCTSPFTLNLAEGSYSFAVGATDAEGNVDLTPAATSFSVDVTAPVVTIAAGPSGAVANTSASFSFTANEGSLQCRIDGAAFAGCTAGSASYTGLSQGAHTFAVRSTDAAGNTGSQSRSWTVDTIAPDTTIASGPSGNNNANPVTFTFSSSEPGTFECKMDAATWSACVSGVSYSGLAKGNHTFQVRAIDAAGNVDASPATRSFGVK